MRRAASVAGIDPELAAPEAEAVMAPAAAALGFRVLVRRRRRVEQAAAAGREGRRRHETRRQPRAEAREIGRKLIPCRRL